MDLPAILTFNSCALKPLGESLWELTGSFEFPKNAQPDSFFVNAVRLPAQNPEVDGDRFAFTAFPSFVQVINENTPGRLKIKSWGALDLEIAKKYENLVLKDSYKIIFDQPFWVEVDVEGSQNIGTEFIDFDLFVEYMGEVYIRPHSGRIDYMKPFILQWEKVKRADNIQRLRYQLIVPSNPNETGGLKVLGFKIRRLYAPADDFSWLEHNMPDYNQGMFLSDKLK